MPDPYSSLSLVLLLIGCYSVFTVISSVLQKSISKRIEEPEFEINFGKQTALGLLENPSIYLLAANLWRMLIVGFIFLLIFNSYSPEFALNHLIALCFSLLVAIALLVIVHIAWSIAYAFPEKALCYLSPFLKPFLKLFYPLAYAAHGLSSLVGDRFSLEEPSESEQVVTVEDIAEMVDYSEESAENQQELDMLKGVVTLGESDVEEIMTPRQDIVSISLSSSVEEMLKIATESGFSIPVIDENLDQVVGLLIVKDLICFLDNGHELTGVNELIRPIMQVPAYDNLLNLLARFRTEKNHFAVVIDDHGGVDGIVTLEDVLEEIVGEIFDESDELEEPESQTTGNGDLLVDGGMLVDDLNEEYDMELPEGEYDTVAGFIIDQMGKLPIQGEILKYLNMQFIIEDLSENRINKVRISLEQLRAS